MQFKGFRKKVSRRSILKAGLYSISGGLLTVGSGGLLDFAIEADQLELTHITIPMTGLPQNFDGYRIIHLTDLHFDPDVALPTIRRAIEMTQQAKPDLIVFTGDLITYWIDEAKIQNELSKLHAPDGVWGVQGNHDHWTDTMAVSRVLRQSGIGELKNTHTPIHREGETMYLAGVDDIWEEQHDLDAALGGIPDNAATILLAHEPDYADEVVLTKRVQLQLSGHSHGGQVRLPFSGTPILSEFIYLAKKYPLGLYDLNGMYLYTSRGVGRGPVPRIFCHPEVAEITLRCA